MEVEVIKKLVKASRKGHAEQVRETAVAERYYRKKNDILKKGARGQVQDGNPMRPQTTGSRPIFIISL